ncbi:MAG: CPBP family intramembrane glutamic endopeptidase [Patescibacteria group bacterium]|jgi:membrane protease YdiL (CAAX protease family)
MSNLRKNQIFIALAAILILASRMISFYSQDYGYLVNTTLFVVFVLLSMYRKDLQRVLILLSVIPAATVFTISLPVPAIFQTLLFYAAIFLTGLIYWYFFEEQKKVTVLRSVTAKQLVVGVIAGQALGIASYVLLPKVYWPQELMTAGRITVPLVFLIFILLAITEELYFRRLLQKEVGEVVNPHNALALSAWLYASLAGSLGFGVTFLALVAGITMALLYSENKSTLQTVIVNITMKLVFLAAIFLM